MLKFSMTAMNKKYNAVFVTRSNEDLIQLRLASVLDSYDYKYQQGDYVFDEFYEQLEKSYEFYMQNIFKD